MKILITQAGRVWVGLHKVIVLFGLLLIVYEFSIQSNKAACGGSWALKTMPFLIAPPSLGVIHSIGLTSNH